MPPDTADERPGMKAARELNVWSPLRECGLTKEQIRRRSEQGRPVSMEQAGIRMSGDQNLYRRNTYGRKNGSGGKSGEFLFRWSFSAFRVRSFEGHARVQIRKSRQNF